MIGGIGCERWAAEDASLEALLTRRAGGTSLGLTVTRALAPVQQAAGAPQRSRAGITSLGW